MSSSNNNILTWGTSNQDKHFSMRKAMSLTTKMCKIDIKKSVGYMPWYYTLCTNGLVLLYMKCIK